MCVRVCVMTECVMSGVVCGTEPVEELDWRHFMSVVCSCEFRSQLSVQRISTGSDDHSVRSK